MRASNDPRAPGLPSSDDYVDEVMQMYDGDGDRTVNKQEFVGFVRKREKALWKAFQSLDLDKNGGEPWAHSLYTHTHTRVFALDSRLN